MKIKTLSKDKEQKQKVETVSNTGQRGKMRRIVLLSIVAFVLVFSIVSMIVTKNIYDGNFDRADAPAYSGYLRYSDLKGYERSEVSFLSGENNLAGYVYGEDNNKGLVVIAHGLGGGAEEYLAETIYFVDNGWRVFAYDCTGSYNSEGKGTKGLPQSAIDLDAALSYIQSQSWNLPVMLYGHSWGGYAVTAVLNYEHDIKAVVSISGYATPMKILHEQAQSMMGWFSNLTFPFEWTYQRLLFGNAAGLSAINGINKRNTPVMIVHGTNDNMILYEGASIIAQRNSITNPNATYVIRDAENQNGHNNLFLSSAATTYIDAVNKEYKTIYENYDGKIPDDIKAEYYDSIDRYLTCQLDPAFINEVNIFFEKHLK